LAFEGLKQSHCVATYKMDVNIGWSGIYSVKNHTLEIRKKSGVLIIKQFKGYKNINAPAELKEEVQKQLDFFNENYDVKMKNELDFEEIF
jgi:hypothetical protein